MKTFKRSTYVCYMKRLLLEYHSLLTDKKIKWNDRIE